MKAIKYTIFAILLFSLQSCKEKDILLYENDPRIGFSLPWYTDFVFRDSISYSFPAKDVDIDTIRFDAVIIGLQDKHQDRQIGYRANSEGTTAIEGTHYKIISSVLPANASRTQMGIEIYRTDDIKDRTVRLELDVVENEFFKFGFERNQKVVFVWGDMYVKPDMWDKTKYKECFGEFSQVSYEFILSNTGLKELPNPDDFQTMQYLNAVVKKALSEYKRINGEDLLDENGKVIFYPTYGGGGMG